MASVRPLAQTRVVLRSTVTSRSLHTSASAQESKGLFGWLRGKDGLESPQQTPSQIQPSASSVKVERTASATGPLTADAPSTAQTVAKVSAQVDAVASAIAAGETIPTSSINISGHERTSNRQARIASDRVIASERKLSLRRGTVWPRYRNVIRSSLQKEPRHLPPSLDLLSDTSHKLSIEERNERFGLLFKHVADRVGRKPEVHDALQLRDSSWNQLLQLATSKEQVDQIVELMPRWIDAKRDFKPSLWALFIERAHQLDAMPTALRVLLEHPKYGIKLPSLDAVANVMRSSVQAKYAPDKTTLSNLVALVAVTRQQRLPVLTSHFRATAHFVGALVDPRLSSGPSATVAHALLPALHRLAAAQPTPPPTWRKDLKPVLGTVQDHLARRNVLARWLWLFRQRNDILRQGEEQPDARAILKEARRAREEAYGGLEKAPKLFHAPGASTVTAADTRDPAKWVPRTRLQDPKALKEAVTQTRLVLRMRADREARRRVEERAKKEVESLVLLGGARNSVEGQPSA